jgi:hypothetical protein
MDISSRYGISKSDAANAIENADSIRHFDINTSNEKPFSLFLKRNKLNSGKEFLLLIFSSREKDKLTVGNSWKYYYEVFNNEWIDNPLMALNEFVQKFGKAFAIGNNNKKIYFNETIKYDKGFPVKVFELKNDGKKCTTSSLITNDTINSILYISYAYCIDMELYSNNLIGNGVFIRK